MSSNGFDFEGLALKKLVEVADGRLDDLVEARDWKRLAVLIVMASLLAVEEASQVTRTPVSTASTASTSRQRRRRSSLMPLTSPS